jgi:hypothetical protein
MYGRELCLAFSEVVDQGVKLFLKCAILEMLSEIERNNATLVVPEITDGLTESLSVRHHCPRFDQERSLTLQWNINSGKGSTESESFQNGKSN